MAQAVCPLCGSEKNHRCFSENNYHVLACEQCELLFIHPYPPSVDEVHRHVATHDYEDLQVLDPDRQYRGELLLAERSWPVIQEECRGGESVLDVGCGCGRLLELLSSIPGLYRAGIELNAARAAMARKLAGCEVHQVPVEEFTSERRFDVITMINVLSHIPSLDRLFEAIRSLLSEGGKLVLKVGERASDVKKNDVFGWGIPDHLHFLGLGTIDFIARKYRFRILRHDRDPISTEMFSRTRWKVPGRSTLRNLIKSVVVHTPLALLVLRKLYEARRGTRVYTSFIVLSPVP